MNIIIAGAGIGGLTAGLCLLKSGHQVRILEQSANFANSGAGIQCGANALHVLDYLQLLEPIQACAVSPLRAEFRNYQTGKALHHITYGAEYQRAHHLPYLHLHRADCQQILRQAFAQRSPASLNLASKVISYNETADSVTVKLDTGEQLECDLLIGADGIKSTLRQQLVQQLNQQSNHTRAKFTGNVAWRGLVPSERLPADFMPTIVSNFVGQGKHMVIYYVRNKTLVNFVGVVENPHWQDDSWVVNAPWQQLKKDFAGWHPTVQAVIDHVDKEQCYRWALYHHQPLPQWHSHRVALLGDAAHASLPFMAAGAAMAIEDARILQRAIDQSNKLSQALTCYQRNRQQRTKKVQNHSIAAGKLYHLKRFQTLAFKALKLTQPNEFLANYNANSIKLN